MIRMIIGICLMFTAACARSQGEGQVSPRDEKFSPPKTVIISGSGYSTEKQYIGLRQVLTIQCDHQNGDACSDLAKMFDRGIGGEKDIQRAAKLNKKACMLGHKESC